MLRLNPGELQPVDLADLGWEHDAELLQLVYKPESGERSLELTVRCNRDLGHAPWALLEGKRLVLAFIDVAVSEHVVFATVGRETLDAIRPGVSAGLHARIAGAIHMGLRFPDLAVSVSFHSGSWLQLICRQLMVGLAPPEPSPDSIHVPGSPSAP